MMVSAGAPLGSTGCPYQVPLGTAEGSTVSIFMGNLLVLLSHICPPLDDTPGHLELPFGQLDLSLGHLQMQFGNLQMQFVHLGVQFVHLEVPFGHLELLLGHLELPRGGLGGAYGMSELHIENRDEQGDSSSMGGTPPLKGT